MRRHFLKACYNSGLPRQVQPPRRPTLVGCVAVLKDILYLSQQQGIYPRQKLHMCAACVKQLWFSVSIHQQQKQHSGEKHFRRVEDWLLFVKNCRVHMSENPFMCGDCRKDLLPSLGLLQHQTTHSKGNSPRSTECRETFRNGEGHYR